ncbi:hypothetical protein [Kitasatospora sp. NBC_00458]|uniref:hypothetical protein n=1 Tax=Kitasatospora sp. NBC_00458 TaxID=2903568 RepID=UPI002E199465
MSLAGGKPVPARTGYGRCAICGRYGRGRWLYDLTPYTAVVEHCPPRRDSPQLTAAAAVSVAALVLLCVLLLTIWH